MNAPLPLFDCRLDASALSVVANVCASGQLAAGPGVPELEQELSARLGGRSVVAMVDSTHALALGLQLAGVGPGDEVMTLAFNCLSSNSALVHVGAKAVWLDLDPATATVDLTSLDAAWSPRTRAVVVYHVAGYPAPLQALRRWCDGHKLPLIEDANNALGALSAGAMVGTVGDFAVLSFYPNRQVNAIDGGALVCAQPAAAAKARVLRRYGIDTTRFRDSRGEINAAVDIEVIGASAAMNNVHATLARHQLHSLDARLARNLHNVQHMTALIEDQPGVQAVRWSAADRPAFWVWLVRCQRRDEVMARMKAAGIGCSTLHHPNDRYSGFQSAPRELAGTRCFLADVLALPCGWWLEEPELQRIAQQLIGATRAAHA